MREEVTRNLFTCDRCKEKAQTEITEVYYKLPSGWIELNYSEHYAPEDSDAQDIIIRHLCGKCHNSFISHFMTNKVLYLD